MEIEQEQQKLKGDVIDLQIKKMHQEIDEEKAKIAELMQKKSEVITKKVKNNESLKSLISYNEFLGLKQF
jgi:hypothetical protein